MQRGIIKENNLIELKEIKTLKDCKNYRLLNNENMKNLIDKIKDIFNLLFINILI